MPLAVWWRVSRPRRGGVVRPCRFPLRDRAIPAEVLSFACRARTRASLEQALGWIWLARQGFLGSLASCRGCPCPFSGVQRESRGAPNEFDWWVGVVLLDMRFGETQLVRIGVKEIT
jgi:hypothetical protein